MPNAQTSRFATPAWALYDFANSAFTTLVVTFIYATYFTKGIAPDETTGADLWFTGITISGIIVALVSPFLGALADQGGYRKRFLFASTVACILLTTALYFPGPGDVMAALVIFIAANVAFEMAGVFYNAYLPDIARLSRIGRISGYGWALGYVGGLLCMVVGLVLFVNPDPPLFGLDADQGEHIRATNLLVALWYALFSIPLFLFVSNRDVANAPRMRTMMRSSWIDIRRVFGDILRYRQVFRLLLARLIYNDGLITVFGAGGVYAAVVFDFSFQQIMIFGIVLNVAAGTGAFALGFLDDLLGGKRTILISIAGLSIATLIAVVSRSVFWFWVAGIGIGLLAGPNQSASRSLLARFTPENHENEFFGFFAFSGKFTAFVGPFMLAKMTLVFDSMRYGVAVVLAMFVIGGILLLRVDENEGVAQSGRAPSAEAIRPV
ncbi:MAG: MFS transporter [Bacteroidetes bacterium CG12_big_fil_rev_8_21_14_0_65_60_17]|nr:MAG: MFS transporter [Bacteroidetes bacterium CG12_big_fil_rev_8_21_14_0_65_60_17]